MKTKYCPCGYPITVDTRWNGLAYIPVFRDGRSGVEISECPNCGESKSAWLWLPPDSENLRLKPGALLDEAPKIWTWWTPAERKIAVWMEGEAQPVYEQTLGAEDVVCDLCNASITTQPVPLLWEGYAVCAKCFQKSAQLTLEEAARRDGIRLVDMAEVENGR